MKLLKIIRRFERFNFYSVLEEPEPMYQRDNHAQHTDRQTGKPVVKHSLHNSNHASMLLGYIKDDFAAKTEIFTRTNPDH